MSSIETTMAECMETPGTQDWARSAHPGTPNMGLNAARFWNVEVTPKYQTLGVTV
jgi:hypothetical protein